MQKTLKNVAHKALCGISAFALAATMSAIPLGGSQALAAEDIAPATLSAQDVTAVNTDTALRAAAYRAGEPAPEILGLSGVGTNTAWQEVGELSWSAPYYYLFGTSEYNSNPNPFMVNAVYNKTNGLSAGDAGYKTPTMIYYSRGQGGPTMAMPKYGSTNTGADEVWKMLPAVILGTGNNVDYSGADYAPKAAAAAGASAGSYDPSGVAYDTTNIYTMIDSMYDLAIAADAADAADASKTLRYGSALAIAQNYERYVRGTVGYILAQNPTLKKVALVNSYDAGSDTYTLVKTGVAEGTAASNRYLETVQPVAVNIADTMETTTISKADLAEVDLIMLGSQAGSENIASTEDILNSFTPAMQQKTYWVNSENGSAGSTYGVVMNSVENAQNFGRILGCLYPEYIDQDDWVTYYYDNFYHLNSGKLAEAVGNAMDGVRNWDAAAGSTYSALTLWTTDDAATYSKSAVEAKLNAGLGYLAENGSSIPSYLPITDNISTAYFSEISEQTYTGTALTPAFSMKLSETGEDVLVVNASGEITTGSDSYNVSYANNVNAGTATISVSAKGGNFFVASTTFTIKPATSAASLDATFDTSSKTYTGSAITPSVSGVKLGSVDLGAGEYTVTYASNTNVGTGTVTVTAVNYTTSAGGAISKSANFTIEPVEQSLVMTMYKAYGDADFNLGVTRAYTVTDRSGAVLPALVFESENESVATVDESGTVSIKSAGVANIIISTAAHSNGIKAASVKFKLVVAQGTQVISASNATKTYGDAAFALGAKLTAGDGALSYASSDTSVATVDATGKVTPKKPGTATITVSAAATTNYAAASKNVTVTVNKAAQAISASNVTKTFGNAAFALGAKLTAGDGALSYASSNTKVATVDASGKVTIKGAGTATITASAAATTNYAAASKGVTVTVNKAANTLTVKGKSTLKAKSAKATTFTAAKAWNVKANKSKGTLTYKKTSGNAKITVASNGKVTVKKGLKKGTYTIKVQVASATTANYKAATAKNVALKIKVS